MDVTIIYLLPAGIIFAIIIIGALIWSIRSGQYEDLDGAANRILHDEDEK